MSWQKKLFGGSKAPKSTAPELLFQVDSDVHIPFMFGDAGIGHITQNPDDANEVAFAWACY